MDAEAEKRGGGRGARAPLAHAVEKMSILKLEHFRREFGLVKDTSRMLLRHPCLFYVSNRYKIHTVVLRDCVRGTRGRS
ncbi:hypothetical protein BAE44_0002980 [Dichanthelium oligosanthes]|uniref:PORR domain-containing protein n=1 Tax=Dichanthelium oligosanthes TaxID=888268 RepID=A0A1E5WF09_9POAL|nr:hypothetical protein BAE44_0002980 [Dichanthelium oligosanthes]